MASKHYWGIMASLLLQHLFTGAAAAAGGIGVNWGMVSDNLPPKPDVVKLLLQAKNINRVRLFDPLSPDALRALRGSGIAVILGTLNQDLQRLANDTSFAAQWVNDNVMPHASVVNFRCVCAGNEVIPGEYAASVLPAMRSFDDALRAAGLHIPVTTAVHMAALDPAASYPPSKGAFSGAALPVMQGIVGFLAANKYPLLVNVYPYFAYAGNNNNNNNNGAIKLEYALGTATNIVNNDGDLSYTNLFDAMVDTMVSAVEKVGGEGVELVVSETGWPSDGDSGFAATIDNAKIYNNNVVAKVKANNGTPKRPSSAPETYLFALFNENNKHAGVEQHFGLFYPNMDEVYPVNF